MKRYLTTPIYYASGAPHLGHSYTTFLADCFKRWYRLLGDDVLLITGTDEHGQKIERSALARGVPVEDFVEARSRDFRRLWRELDIDIDRFQRTTSEAHKKVAKDVWRRLQANGDIYAGRYEGLYCVDCEQYFTGGDECTVHRRPLETFSEPSWFFRLGAYRDRLIAHIRAHPDFIRPRERRNEVMSLLEGNVLNDLSISRTSTRWGVQIPGDESRVMYVWIDALATYLSALGAPDSRDTLAYWPEAIHFIGKDILVFHAIYWPAFLMSARLPLPRSIIVNGWLTVEGRKIAKSDPTTNIDPVELAKRVSSDGLRWYFLKGVSLGQDVDFNRANLVRLVNADLANNLGNLVGRFVALAQRCFGEDFEVSPYVRCEADRALLEALGRNADVIEHAMAAANPARGARTFMRAAAAVNAYFQEQEPWRLEDRDRQITVLGVVYQALCDLTVLGRCFVPSVCTRVRRILYLPPVPAWGDTRRQCTRVRTRPADPVFPRVDPF